MILKTMWQSSWSRRRDAKWFLLSGLSALQNIDPANHHSCDDEDDEEHQNTDDNFVVICNMRVIRGGCKSGGINV